jgi:predicted RNA binding protein YcfA (HicA-like mRNA interferase family)
MVKPAKLLPQLLRSSDRSVAFRDFVALIEALGFVRVRTKGSHQSYRHNACPKILVIQPKGNDAKRYQVRELLELIEEHGLHMME